MSEENKGTGVTPGTSNTKTSITGGGGAGTSPNLGASSSKSTVKKSTIILKNTSGKDVDEKDYFFGGKALPSFNAVCGKPVDREDLLEIFDKVFDPSLNFLFYKALNKEVYIVIIPIKNSSTIGEFNNSIEGDFQKHAISFINEGSVNLETLKLKLKRIEGFVKYTDR